MLIGYARCSTADQNLDWQLDALKKNGCERTMDELAAARARGRLGGRPKADPKKIAQALAMYEANKDHRRFRHCIHCVNN